MRRLLALALAVLLLGALSAVPAAAQDGNVINDGTNYVGMTLIVVDPAPDDPTPGDVIYCGVSMREHNAVAIPPGGGPAISLRVAFSNFFLQPGEGFIVVDQDECNVDPGRTFLTLLPAGPVRPV